MPDPAHPRTGRKRSASAALLVTVLIAVSGCSETPGEPETAKLSSESRRAQAQTFVAEGERLDVGGCPVFPRDHVFHADVRALKPAATNAATLAAMGTDSPVRVGIGSGVWEGSRPGIPVNVIDRSTAVPTDIVVYYEPADPTDPLGIPMPPGPRFEGWPGKAWDKHLLLVDPGNCMSTELINVHLPGEHLFFRDYWYADGVARFDLSSNDFPEKAVTVSGTSLLSGMIRYDEVASGDIGHVIGLTWSAATAEAIWPADDSDGPSRELAAPPMGTWFRLRPDVDLSGLGPQARTIARALQVHGGVLVDTGPGFTVLGEPDLRWNDKDLGTLTSLAVGDFEVVDASPMMVDPESHQIR